MGSPENDVLVTADRLLRDIAARADRALHQLRTRTVDGAAFAHQTLNDIRLTLPFLADELLELRAAVLDPDVEQPLAPPLRPNLLQLTIDVVDAEPAPGTPGGALNVLTFQVPK